MANRLSSWIKSFFGGDNAKSAGGLLAGVMQGPTAARRGTRELLDAYRTDGWLHSIVWRIGTAVAGVQLQLFRDKTRAGAPAQKILGKSSIGYRPKEGVEVLAHPLLDLIRNPSPLFTPSTFWCLVSAFLDVKGECFLVIERGTNGLPKELWVVPPHWCTELPRTNFPSYRFSQGTWIRSIPESDVIYLRHPDLLDPYKRGVGTAETIADEIDIDEFAAEHLKSWFFNRALPDIFLSVEGVSSESEAVRYENKLRAKHGGVGKAFQVHVTSGKVDLKQVGHTFREQQLPEIRQQTRDTRLQVFGVPPEIAGIIENSNRATIDAAEVIFTRYVIAPRAFFIADHLTHWARVEYADPSLCLGFESPVPEDREFTLKVMTAQPDLFSKNEWRELAGRQPREEFGDDLTERPASPLALPGDAGAANAGKEDPEEPEDSEEEKALAAGASRRLLRAVNALGK